MNDIIKEEQSYLNFTNINLQNEIEKSYQDLKEIPKKYTRTSQGDAFLVESLMSMVARKLRKLELSQGNPYFGRIDFEFDDTGEHTTVYIGKTNISGKDGEQVTTDWRTPICSLYYDGNIGATQYNAPEGVMSGKLKIKRQIIIKNGQITNITENDIAEDELLRPYLSINADNRMKTIIASIQKEQNEIIRKPLSQNIVVQGVAGSGKTSVALHKIAYLVYSLNEEIKSNQFLLLGPNPYFLNYISSVLPELDTEPVEQMTYIDLVNYFLKDKLVLENQSESFCSKNDANTIERIQAYKASLNYKESIDYFMKKYLQSGIIQNGIEIDGEEIYSAELINSILKTDVGGQLNFDRACNYFVNNFKNNYEEIYRKLNEKYRKIYMSAPKDSQERNLALTKSLELEHFVKQKGTNHIKQYFKKIQLKPFNIYQIFISSLEDNLVTMDSNDIKILKDGTLAALQKKKVSFEDLPALLHINYLLNGKVNQYKHVAIDEAQDYGMFHFFALREMFPNSTFSIYGDLAQSIYSYRSISDWESLATTVFDDNCEILRLNKSYRTTVEITNNANKILQHMKMQQADPVIRHGEEISFVNCATDEKYKIKKIIDWIDKGYKSIAIVCKNDKEAKRVFESLKDKNLEVAHITSKDQEYNCKISVLTCTLSKGLEFDAVMINDASENVYSEKSSSDMHLLYVACTRALHELQILYRDNLCKVFNDDEMKLDGNQKSLK